MHTSLRTVYGVYGSANMRGDFAFVQGGLKFKFNEDSTNL